MRISPVSAGGAAVGGVDVAGCEVGCDGASATVTAGRVSLLTEAPGCVVGAVVGPGSGGEGFSTMPSA